MGKVTAIGIQDFEKIRRNAIFYVDKTSFIKEWWEKGDDVTLITRPRRFGKTLNMSMLDYFFSNKYEGRGDLFEGLSIWEEETYRGLQGTYPVIALSFAGVKARTYQDVKYQIYCALAEVCRNHPLVQEHPLNSGSGENMSCFFPKRMPPDITEGELSMMLHHLSEQLFRYHGKKVLIFLDEYDTPMQEAWVSGFWDEMVSLCRNLFNNTFKTNPYMERAVVTGITRISRESIFSDLNNLRVVTTTSTQYADSFGFTESEVFQALDEQGLSNQKELVKRWYDGFVFGGISDIYNPWSIICFLAEKQIGTYWANTSSNGLINTLIRRGDKSVKLIMEDLLDGRSFEAEIDEQIVFSQLGKKKNAIWSLFLASGYLKTAKNHIDTSGCLVCELALTNFEVKVMFEKMIREWFGQDDSYNEFIRALLAGNIEEMNIYMNRVFYEMASFFDTGKPDPQKDEMLERFYHGFVLGLIVDLRNRYRITSNRESGYGRYDVLLEPLKDDLDGMVLEFKVFNSKKEKKLEDTAASALAQIRERDYDAELVIRGIPKERIRHYGFAFKGKNVYIEEGL